MRCLSDWSSDVCSSDLDASTTSLGLVYFIGPVPFFVLVPEEVLQPQRGRRSIRHHVGAPVLVILNPSHFDVRSMDRSEERRVGEEDNAGLMVSANDELE